jgi:hypothetical protein
MKQTKFNFPSLIKSEKKLGKQAKMDLEEMEEESVEDKIRY